MSRNTPAKVVRCAIYGRKSTEEGLDQEFNSLDAQRESGEAFIKSQASEGWVCLPETYADGGYTGGNIDRPALKRLLADIEAGKVDCVVVYKVDRLSRSLLDFARMMETFEKHRVSFVSVTQHFNTASSMGRLILNVLLSFAQFERELISERTRDKIAATRRKGKWAGGHPILGYDVDERTKLVVNEGEAQRVREIFDLYLKHEALLPVVQELARRGWNNKRWTTRKGRTFGGSAFSKTTLYGLLTNVAYAGNVRYKKEVHPGEHAGIVDPAIWQRAQTILRRNGQAGGSAARNKTGALLKGILRCGPCDCAMTPTYSCKNGTRRYRYYVCTSAQKHGHQTCPSKSLPAHEIERFVVDRIKCIGRDPGLLKEVVAQANSQAQGAISGLDSERRALERDLATWHADVRKLAGQEGPSEAEGPVFARLADLNERIRCAERRATELREELAAARRTSVAEHDVAFVLAHFDPVWESLSPREQARVIELLVERVQYDGTKGKLSITFHPVGIKTLAAEMAGDRKGRSA
jgi:site-specific DNA recombinase